MSQPMTCTCGWLSLTRHDVKPGEWRVCPICLDRFSHDQNDEFSITYKFPPVRKEA